MRDAKFKLLAEVVDEVARVRGQAKQIFASVHGLIDLKEIELTVLNAVAEAVTPPTVSRIGRSLGHPRQVIQRAANALIDRGFVAAGSNPDHKRAPLLSITRDGHEAKCRADKLAAQLAGPIARQLNTESLRAAATALRDIRAAIELANGKQNSRR